MPKASIIIRSKDEEHWIKHCLQMVHAQSFTDFEVILVDNESQDATIEVAQREGVTTIVTVGEYRPGHALNAGIEQSTGDFIVCLSAHCVARDENWLEALLRGFEDDRVAGVYGRQLPLSFSSDNDKRDLLITFGLDRRVQVKDYFFHNANSAIRKVVWQGLPFDDETTNIEDRIWAQAVISAGFHLVYEPDAAVYHHHGIHQDRDRVRAKNIVSILEKVEPASHINSLPESMKPAIAHVSAVCPVLGEIRYHKEQNLLASLVEELNSATYVDSVYLLSENPDVRALASDYGARFIERPDSLYPPAKSVEDVLSFALAEIERGGEFPQVILYANHLFPHRPQDYFDELATELLQKGLDTVFGGYPEYSNYWVQTPQEKFEIVGDGLKPRAAKRPLYQALYGLGTAVIAADIRKGRLIGDRVGILTVSDRACIEKVD